jgi:hypothetical protein
VVAQIFSSGDGFFPLVTHLIIMGEAHHASGRTRIQKQPLAKCDREHSSALMETEDTHRQGSMVNDPSEAHG